MDFQVFIFSDVVKRENGKPYKEVTKAIINRTASEFPGLPYNAEMPQMSDGVVDLEASPIYNLEIYDQPSIKHDKLNKMLKKEASNATNKISFGIVNMARCGNNIDEPGHMIVYFSTSDDVWYVDAQCYDGELQCDNKTIFSDLSEVYKFAGKHRLGVNVFGSLVYYTPMNNIACIDAAKTDSY